MASSWGLEVLAPLLPFLEARARGVSGLRAVPRIVEMLLEARYLTSADVSRRLGVEGGTVRYYAELLREMGFSMPKEEETGAYLWAPELVEVARVALAMARATKGLSFREAVELILYAGEAAQHARAGRSVLTLLQEATNLHRELRELVEEVRRLVKEEHEARKEG